MPGPHDELQPATRLVRPRGILLGLVGVVTICVFTPFNNYVLNNTDAISSHFPLAVLLLLLIVVLGINAPLSRFRKTRWMFTGGDLAVALSMWLIASSMPAVGLMRYLPGHIAGPPYLAAERPQAAEMLETLNLPDWIMPTRQADDLVESASEEVIRGFYLRTPAPRDTFWQRVQAVPWSNWFTPAVSWGVFILAVTGGAVFMSLLWHRQWADVERLPFPIAGVYLALTDAPRPGRWLNDMLSARRLWIAAALVFFVHATRGLNLYFPDHVPIVSAGFNLLPYTQEPPIAFSHWTFRMQTVIFTVVGIMLFVRGDVVLSLWVCYVLQQCVRMMAGTYQVNLTDGMIADQTNGAVAMLALWVLFISRRHLAAVLRSFFSRERRGDWFIERVAAVGAGLCFVILVVWLVSAGTTWIGAVVITTALAALYLVLARLVAESGILYSVIPIEPHRIWLYTLSADGVSGRTTGTTHFFSGMFTGMLCHDVRQAVPGYATTALRIEQNTDRPASASPIRSRLTFVAVLVGTLLLAYVLSGAATLYTRYNYELTLDRAVQPLDGGWGSLGMQRLFAVDTTINYQPPRAGPAESHDRLTQVATGAGIIGVLRQTFTWWPIAPVGFLMCWSWGMSQIWFSVFLADVSKRLTLWLGGGAGLQWVKPIFVGLIIGESGAALFWLMVAFARASMGLEYFSLKILP
jgi:hypothetical protein